MTRHRHLTLAEGMGRHHTPAATATIPVSFLPSNQTTHQEHLRGTTNPHNACGSLVGCKMNSACPSSVKFVWVGPIIEQILRVAVITQSEFCLEIMLERSAPISAKHQQIYLDTSVVEIANCLFKGITESFDAARIGLFTSGITFTQNSKVCQVR